MVISDILMLRDAGTKFTADIFCERDDKGKRSYTAKIHTNTGKYYFITDHRTNKHRRWNSFDRLVDVLETIKLVRWTADSDPF